MSTNATTASSATSNTNNQPAPASPADKGKGKVVQDEVMDDEEEDDDDEEEEEEEDDEMEDDDLTELDTTAILAPGARRTRGVRVDYSSAEALAKAGLKPEDVAADDEGEESFVAKDDEMQE